MAKTRKPAATDPARRDPDALLPVTVRFNPAQLAAVEAAADLLGIDRAQYIRMGALRECGYAKPKPAAPGSKE